MDEFRTGQLDDSDTGVEEEGNEWGANTRVRCEASHLGILIQEAVGYEDDPVTAAISHLSFALTFLTRWAGCVTRVDTRAPKRYLTA